MVEIEGTDQSLGACGFVLGYSNIKEDEGFNSIEDFFTTVERCNWPLDYSAGSGVCPVHGVALPIVKGNA